MLGKLGTAGGWVIGKVLGKRAAPALLEASVAAETAALKRTLPGLLTHPVTLVGGTAAVTTAALSEQKKERTWTEFFVGPEKPKTSLFSKENMSDLSGTGALMFGAIGAAVTLLGGGVAALFEVPVTTGGIALAVLGVGAAAAAGGAVFGKKTAEDAQKALSTAMKPAATPSKATELAAATAPHVETSVEVTSPPPTPPGGPIAAKTPAVGPGF